jgi:hypothetical protein
MSSLKRTHAAGLALVTLILVLVCSGDAVPRRPKTRAEHSAALESGTETKGAPDRAAGRIPTAQAAPQKPVGQLLRVFVWGDTIYPAAAHVRPGLLKLRLENQTAADVSLVVTDPKSSTGAPVASLGTANKEIRTEQVVQLAPGEYVFYERNHTTVKGILIVDVSQ